MSDERDARWMSALIDESQVKAWVMLGRMYAAIWREMIDAGVPEDVAKEILLVQIESVFGAAMRAAKGEGME